LGKGVTLDLDRARRGWIGLANGLGMGGREECKKQRRHQHVALDHSPPKEFQRLKVPLPKNNERTPMAQVAILIVALLHILFFALESLLWTKPAVRKAFGNSEEVAETTRILALNQGFYNLGVAILLLYFHFGENPAGVRAILIFIVAMGVVGAATASRGILLLQAVPAAIALALMAGKYSA